MPTPRPKFCPSPCDAVASIPTPLLFQSGEREWLPLISCPADFPIELFELAISQLVHHPEYNSTLILRSETVSETTSDFPSSIPMFNGLRIFRNIHRRLLPRRPGRDSALEQHCTLYGPCDGDAKPSTLVLTPILQPGVQLPYYHPTVYNLALRYIAADTPLLRIEVVPHESTPTDPNSRLYRTCLALLDTLHRYGWGSLTSYKKRVIHDCLIPREDYQDLYLIMRERHKHLVDEWQEVTDPLKHVFEDIGIATFLMLLWKNTFQIESHSGRESERLSVDDEPWKNWARPPAGFLDMGCGNGLLTHILTAEGYEGHGIDLRARTSWSHYPKTTQERLHVQALDPLNRSSAASQDQQEFLRPGVFIVGNHADELTPWVPVLATLYSASGYLSIPCCAWSFDTRYERSATALFSNHPPEFVESLNLGGDGSNSSAYSMYRIWLASLSLHCGWEVECESLRIPSTRNWAIIGRRRGAQDENELEQGVRNAEDIVKSVRERGMFKTRRPEGKAGDH